MNRRNCASVFGVMLTFVFSLTSFSAAFSQGRAQPQKVTSTINNLDSYNKFIYDGNSVSMSTQMRGSNYIYEEWQPATLVLAGDTVEVPNVNVRVDVVNRVLEVEQDGVNKIFPSFLIKTATLTNTKEVISPRKVVGKDGPPGFFGVLYDGKSPLYIHYSTQIKQANYNPALDSGRTWDEILLVKTYYARISGELVKLEKKKSKRMAQLGGDRVADYIDAKDIDIRQDAGLIQVLTYLDSENQ